jgi:quinol monooxygenase YgiN
MINKWIQFTVSADNSNDFEAALQTLEKESKVEVGCAHYAVFKVTDAEGVFTVLECWETKEAFEAHRVAPHISQFKENCGSMIIEKSAQSLSSIS